MKYKTSVEGQDVRTTGNNNILYNASEKSVFKTSLAGQFNYTFPSSLTAGKYTLGTINHNLGYLPAIIFSCSFDGINSIKSCYTENGTLGVDLCAYMFKVEVTTTQLKFVLEILGDSGSDYINLTGKSAKHKYYVIADPLIAA